MSVKSDHHADDAKGSVLKKAVSFRNDLKFRITRKSSSAFTENAVAKPVKKKSFTRSGSFNDTDSVSSAVKKNNDCIEKLREETAKVSRGLRYIQDVVDKGILEQFHGSVTIVLDQITELKSVIQKCFPSKESSQLRSEFGALHQNLAKLMGLSDPMLLSSEESFINKQEATDLISSIKSSIEELIHLAEENAENTKSQKYSSENRNDVANVDLNFESDLSVALDDHDDSTLLTHSESAKSKSAENLLNVCHTPDTSVDEIDSGFSVKVQAADLPPPKPPLPHNLWDVGKFSSMPRGFSLRHGADEVPPPLPEKKRNSAGLYDVNVSSHLPVNFSQNLAVPCCHSPTNSISSAFSGSSEEILDDGPPKPSRIPRSSFDRRDSRSSQYDNMNDSSFEYSSPTDFADIATDGQLVPPPLPAKKGSTSCPGGGGGICLGSPYDNVFEHASSMNVVSTTFETDDVSKQLSPNLTTQFLNPMLHTSSSSSNQTVRKYVSKVSTVHEKKYSANVLQSRIVKSSQVNYTEVLSTENSHVPPPIPPKRHVQAYLSAFGECSSSSASSLSYVRHSMHATTHYEMYPQIGDIHGMWCAQDFPSRGTSLQCSFPSISASSDGITTLSKSSSQDSGLNPALPPKQRDQSSSRTTLDSGYYSTAAINNPAIMMPESNSVESGKVFSPDSDNKMSYPHDVSSAVSDVDDCSVTTETTVTSKGEKLLEVNVLEEEEVTDRLVFKQPNEDGPDVRGGSVDALIVHATTPGQNDYQFQEAFLMTYRTFISPCDLIKKLLQRYNQFSRTDDVKKKKLARNAFSFLIRVVDDLCRETSKELLQILMDLVYQLLNDGELQMARAMRKQVLDKSENYRVKQAASHSTTLLSSYKLTTKAHSIIDFKAVSVAEQMTLLDAELFNKIEIPEVLRWSREQSEELSPNLTKFTEHFNKMSYWCRTRILEQDEPKDRERHLMKFIKVMKHLRRLNNFNSYLAILSAVDSAPVRRLEWQKQNVEALKEFCELIDSSSSFRAYRQALADTTPPCIPYIGLVLQDLTFVNIGNLDYLPDGNINFSKCWQYFTILQNMSRFRKCNYDFKKNEKIIAFFNNFDYYLSEESLWQLSEMIKPRGSKTSAKQTE